MKGGKNLKANKNKESIYVSTAVIERRQDLRINFFQSREGHIYIEEKILFTELL